MITGLIVQSYRAATQLVTAIDYRIEGWQGTGNCHQRSDGGNRIVSRPGSGRMFFSDLAGSVIFRKT